jgi:hypothetical protein
VDGGVRVHVVLVQGPPAGGRNVSIPEIPGLEVRGNSR